MPTDADDAVKQEDEITKMPLTEVEALDPAVTCKFLDAMDRDEDGGLRFKQMLRRKPMHPVVKCVFERKPQPKSSCISRSSFRTGVQVAAKVVSRSENVHHARLPTFARKNVQGVLFYPRSHVH